MNKLLNNKGEVTRYGLACGYVQLSRDGKIRLEKVAYGPGIMVRSDNGHRVEYLGPYLAQARNAYRRACKS